jgi:hypothetical protein
LQISFYFVGETLLLTGEAFFTGEAFLGEDLASGLSILAGDRARSTLERIAASYSGSACFAGLTSWILVTFSTSLSFSLRLLWAHKVYASEGV